MDNDLIDIQEQISDLLQDIEDLASVILQSVICLKILTNPGDINELVKELETNKS